MWETSTGSKICSYTILINNVYSSLRPSFSTATSCFIGLFQKLSCIELCLILSVEFYLEGLRAVTSFETKIRITTIWTNAWWRLVTGGEIVTQEQIRCGERGNTTCILSFLLLFRRENRKYPTMWFAVILSSLTSNYDIPSLSVSHLILCWSCRITNITLYYTVPLFFILYSYSHHCTLPHLIPSHLISCITWHHIGLDGMRQCVT